MRDLTLSRGRDLSENMVSPSITRNVDDTKIRLTMDLKKTPSIGE